MRDMRVLESGRQYPVRPSGSLTDERRYDHACFDDLDERTATVLTVPRGQAASPELLSHRTAPG